MKRRWQEDRRFHRIDIRAHPQNAQRRRRVTAERPTPAGDADDTGRPKVYLCQVGSGVSCGACCGLYNVAELSRELLENRLARRSRRFAGIERTEDGIEQFRRETLGWTPEERPFPRFYHCPFLGLIGRGQRRVGCLLHPEAAGNQGRDFRYVSYYGAKACAGYFCPAYRSISSRHLLILQNLFDDWYDYGLIITEHRLLKAVFAALETRLDRPIGPVDVPPRSTAADALRDLLRLKLAWPHRSREAPGPCHFPFDNGLYPRPEIAWPAPQPPEALYRIIFQEMESRFSSAQDVAQAIALLDHHVAATVNAAMP